MNGRRYRRLPDLTEVITRWFLTGSRRRWYVSLFVVAAVTIWWNWPEIVARPGVSAVLERLTRSNTPTIDSSSEKQDILVARLTGDQNDEYQNLIIAALASELARANLHPLEEALLREGANASTDIERANVRAQRILEESGGGDVVLWGRVLRSGNRTTADLFWTFRGRSQYGALGRHTPTESTLEFPTLSSDVSQAIEQAEAEYAEVDRTQLGIQLASFADAVNEGPAPISDPVAPMVRVHFIDVGEGEAVWIHTRTPNSPPRNILIDGGPDEGEVNRLPAYLNANGLRYGTTIDDVIVTHYHDDHYAGLRDVLSRFQVRRLIVPHTFPTSPSAKELLDAARTETADGANGSVMSLEQEVQPHFEWGAGVSAAVLSADGWASNDLGSGNTNQNNQSIVLRMTYGASSFLFMGDALGKNRGDSPDTSRYIEGYLLRRFVPGVLRSNVLKVAHHGSESASTLPFLRAVAPDIAVINAGRRSFAGFFLPDPGVIERIRSIPSGPEILRTDYLDEIENRTTRDDQDHDDIFIDTDGTRLDAYQARVDGRNRRWTLVKRVDVRTGRPAGPSRDSPAARP
jgi:beta-lactamase superfamily II metal-dependent hydrolase